MVRAFFVIKNIVTRLRSTTKRNLAGALLRPAPQIRVRNMKHIAIAFIFVCLVGCQTPPPPPNHSEYLNGSTLWMQTAAENRALAYQAFHLARAIFDRDSKTARRNEKRAVVVDVDETVLDNAPFQSLAIVREQTFPNGWREWVERADAKPLAGAVEFLTYAKSKGARIFYVTNRSQEEKRATMANLNKARFPDVTDDTVVCKDKDSSKEARREAIRKTHRIVLLMGDNLGDFSREFDKLSVDQRLSAVDRLQDKFGTYFVVLPNPVYGDWEGAVYDYNWSKTPTEREYLRRQVLDRASKRTLSGQ